MLRIAQQYFSEELQKSPSSLHYLHEKRNLSDEVIRAWGLGYAPDATFGLVKLLLSKGFTEQDCIALGLARKKDG